MSISNPMTPRQLVAQALRSGKYKQGKYALKRRPIGWDEYAHCCLGVACEVYLEQGGTLNQEDRREWPKYVEVEFEDVMFDGECDVLPKPVAQWLDMNPDGELGDVSKHNFDGESLTTFNDIYDWTFDKIADLFETGKFYAYGEGASSS